MSKPFTIEVENVDPAATDRVHCEDYYPCQDKLEVGETRRPSTVCTSPASSSLHTAYSQSSIFSRGPAHPPSPNGSAMGRDAENTQFPASMSEVSVFGYDLSRRESFVSGDPGRRDSLVSGDPGRRGSFVSGDLGRRGSFVSGDLGRRDSLFSEVYGSSIRNQEMHGPKQPPKPLAEHPTTTSSAVEQQELHSPMQLPEKKQRQVDAKAEPLPPTAKQEDSEARRVTQRVNEDYAGLMSAHQTLLEQCKRFESENHELQKKWQEAVLNTPAREAINKQLLASMEYMMSVNAELQDKVVELTHAGTRTKELATTLTGALCAALQQCKQLQAAQHRLETKETQTVEETKEEQLFRAICMIHSCSEETFNSVFRGLQREPVSEEVLQNYLTTLLCAPTQRGTTPPTPFGPARAESEGSSSHSSTPQMYQRTPTLPAAPHPPSPAPSPHGTASGSSTASYHPSPNPLPTTPLRPIGEDFDTIKSQLTAIKAENRKTFETKYKEKRCKANEPPSDPRPDSSSSSRPRR